MNYVQTVDELKRFIGADGVLVKPVTLKAGEKYNDLSFLKSFKNMVLADGVHVLMVNNVKSMKWLKMGVDCNVDGLVQIRDLSDLKANKRLTLGGLLGLIDFGLPVIAEGCTFSWLENLKTIRFNDLMWPKDVTLYGFPNDLDNHVPKWLIKSKRVTIKR